MRPDLDDFDDIDTPEAPRSRFMSWMVLGVAVIGFAALAHYAYRSGTQSAQEGDMLVVQADTTPIKQAPADPDGEKFPNKDKTIYDVISPASGEQKVEKLLPDPEHAVASGDMAAAAGEEDTQPATAPAQPAPAAPATTTYVNKNLDNSATTAAPAPASKPAPAPVKTGDPSIAAPTMINEKPAKAAAADVASTVVKDVPVAGVTATKAASSTPKPAAAKPAAKPAAKGDYKIQLGALKSEAEAQAAWKKITAKYGDTITGAPIILKVDTANGTLYRLRASGFASADAAKAACTKLSAAKQPCFPVGK